MTPGGQKTYLDKAELRYVEKNDDNFLFEFLFKLFELCQLS